MLNFRARAAYVMYSDYPHYMVSEFYDPEWYLNTAFSAGARAELVYDVPAAPFDPPAEIAKLYAAFDEWSKSASKKLDSRMRDEITRELAGYSVRIFHAYSYHLKQNALGQFSREWIDPLVRALVRMPPE